MYFFIFALFLNSLFTIQTMKKTFIAIACAALCAANMYGQTKGHFNNPVIPGDVADPSIIRIGNTWYATGTSSEWAPYYPMFTSTDLVNWKQTGHIFDKQPEWTVSSFWAPELYYMNNKVYAYYTARNKKGVSYIGVATADDPTKEFTDHGPVVEYGTEAIDAFILEDNGKQYISWKAYGLDNRPIELLCSQLSDDGLSLVGETFTLMRDDDRIGMEGQCHFKKGDYYYMLYSTHSCCGPKSDYQVRVARSKTLKGPYEIYDGNPVLHGGSDKVQSCGHGTVTTTPDGRMFYFFHAYLTGGRFFAGRQPMLQEMVIGDDGWIHFPTGDTAQLEQPLPFKGKEQKATPGFFDNFKNNKLKAGWTWNYPYTTVNIHTGKGKLSLSGTMKEGNHNGSALCLRPVKPDYAFATQVINHNSSLKGLTLYGDDKTLVAFGAQGDKLILKEVIDGKEQIVCNEPLPATSPYLKIEVNNGTQCTFFWSKDGKTWQALNNIAPKRDYSKQVRWDRVARPGLIHCGLPTEPAEYSYFRLL